MIQLDFKVLHKNTPLAHFNYTNNISKLGVVGNSGSGKSVLLKSIASQFSDENSFDIKGRFKLGDLIFNSELTNGDKLDDYKFGYIPQDSIRGYIGPTVLSEISTSIYCSSNDTFEAQITLDKWKLTSPISSFYSRSPLTLSTGESRLLLIESAILSKPDILFIDGGITTLSTDFQERVNLLIKEWLQEKPTRKLIWTETNKEGLARIVDDIFFLKSDNSITKSITWEKRNIQYPLLKFNGVSGGPKVSSEPLIKNADFSIYPNEIVGIIGKNGSGKSTLLKMISGAIKTIKGDILYQNRSIKSGGYPGIKNGIGYLPEELDVAGAYSEIINSQDIKSTEFTDRNLSYWEKSSGQQVEHYLNWLIEYKPNLLVLDEPSSRVEKSTLIKIISNLYVKNHNLSILLATHDFKLLELLNARVIKLNNGYLES